MGIHGAARGQRRRPLGDDHGPLQEGVGARRNVEADALSKIDGTFTDDDGAPVTVSVTNPQPASGGTDRQTIAQINALAPRVDSVLNRTVSREDFEINARRLPDTS